MTIVLNFLIFLFLSFFNGKIFFHFFKEKINFNFFEISFLGIIVTGLCAQFINIFSPLNNIILFINFVLIAIYIFYYKLFEFKFNKEIFYISILIFPFVFLNIWASDFSDDLNHYHHSFILNSDYYKNIIGYNFLHNHYGLSSIWLITQAYFNFDYSRLQDIHNLNGLIYFLFLCTYLVYIRDLLNKKKINFFESVIFATFFFVILKYTRLKEFGIDRPGYLIFFFSLYLLIKYDLLFKKELSFQHLSLFLCIIFLIFNKIIFLFFIIYLIYILIFTNNLNFLKINYFYFFFIISIGFFTKNIMYTGCLVYPVDFLCFQSLPWTDIKYIKNFILNVESFIKGYHLYSGELDQISFSKNLNWLDHAWINRNKIELVELYATIFLSFSLIFFSSNKIKDNDNKAKMLKNIFILIIIFIPSFLLMMKSPAIRMNHHIFFITLIIFFSFFYLNYFLKIKKEFLVLIIILTFIFNITKNVSRIYKNPSNNHLEKLKKRGWYGSSKRLSLDNFIYYYGWYDAAPSANNNLGNKNLKHKRIYFYDIIYKDN